MQNTILLVHFGTMNKKAIENSIRVLEKEVEVSLKEKGENYKVISCFMLKRISTLLKTKENIDIKYLEDVLNALKTKTQNIIIQPVYLIDGDEYKKIEKIEKEYKAFFENIKIGKPIIYGETKKLDKQCEIFIESIKDIVFYNNDKVQGLNDKNKNLKENNENPKSNKSINLFIGHGSNNIENNQYQILENKLKKISKNTIVGTLTGNQNKEYIIKFLKEKNIEKVRIHLLFMLIGKHVKLDVLEGENSFVKTIENENIEVEVIEKSLLLNKNIRDIFIKEILSIRWTI